MGRFADEALLAAVYSLRAGEEYMQNVPSLRDVSLTPVDQESVAAESAEITPERTAAVWVNRFTGLIGVVFLALALVAWFTRHGHYRLVLAFLIVALFASILHSYTFENGDEI
jgi:hypothetical protein